MRRRLIAATVAGVALIALWVATALASESAPTTVTLEQSPGYLYIGDEVTLTATVTPNPGGGTVTFSYGGVIPEIAVVPVDPGTGTATLTFAPTFHFGAVDVYAAFGGTASFGWSQTNLYVDVRWLPIAGIIETPAPATNDTDASIAFLASPEISTQCRLDGESFADCTSPVHLHDLTEGEHTFDVRATVIADGHVGRIATTTWFTDLTGPVPGDVQLDGGATTTNRQQVLLTAPATDALSGIQSFRVSSTGLTDSDGRLADDLDRRWIDGSTVTWYPDRTAASGPQTVYVQWTDFAGNVSAVVSRTIDVRIAALRLGGGAWQTDTASTEFALQGIDPGEVDAVRVSNRPHFEDGLLVEATQFDGIPSTWSVTDSAAGGSETTGTKVVYAQWRDAHGRWSDVFQQAIAYRPLIPVDVFIEEGDVAASRLVHATFVIADLLPSTNLAIRLSCDGSHWIDNGLQTVAQLIPLDNPSAGCPPGDGPRTIHFRWRLWYPFEGPESDERTVSITLDSTAPPAPSASSSRVAGAGGAIMGSAVPVVFSWAPVGGMHYQVRQSIDGHAFSAPVGSSSSSAVRQLVPGHAYRFSVRSVDGIGHIGPWMASQAFMPRAVAQSSPLVHYHGSWTTSTSTTWWGSTARSSSSAGATATYTFTGKSIAWVGLKAYNRGKAQVFVNGVLKATVDLYSATTKKQVVVWSQTYSTSATRTITVKVLGTVHRPRVDVDGFIVGS